MAGGAFGLAGSLVGYENAPTAVAAPAAQDAEATLRDLKPALQSISASLHTAFESNSLAQGAVTLLRAAYTNHYKANNRFPSFIDVGFGVFYDVYDWHIKHNQPVLVNRGADGRLSIDFMFTRLYVRVEYSEMQIGIPYDRA
jgi:hypothetical protein